MLWFWSSRRGGLDGLDPVLELCCIWPLNEPLLLFFHLYTFFICLFSRICVFRYADLPTAGSDQRGTVNNFLASTCEGNRVIGTPGNASDGSFASDIISLEGGIQDCCLDVARLSGTILGN